MFASCKEMFDYSPYVIDFDEKDRNINNKNIAKIESLNNTDKTVRIAFTADTHRNSDELDEFVHSVNKMNETKAVDFVIHLGDFADFGLPKQYLWANSYLSKLNMPYVVVLGNHDLVGNGGDSYHEMFGDFNTSFIYDSIKFISINTNSREFEYDGTVPNINWLDKQLKPSSDFTKAVVLFHVPPMDVDFDSQLEEDFVSTLSKYNNVILSVHGHLHHYETYVPYSNNITFLNTYAIENDKYNVVELVNDTFKIMTYDL